MSKIDSYKIHLNTQQKTYLVGHFFFLRSLGFSTASDRLIIICYRMKQKDLFGVEKTQTATTIELVTFCVEIRDNSTVIPVCSTRRME